MKKLYISFTALFFSVLTVFTLLTVFIPDKDYSETENRTLAQKPQLNFETIANGDFQTGLGDYLSDQFPLRDEMIKLNTIVNKLSGVKNINGAYIGKNGYYFEVITNSKIISKDFEKNLSAINTFSEKYPDIDVNTILVPTSSYIYKEYLPDGAEIYDGDNLFNIANEKLANGNFIDIRNSFISNKEKYLYYKTDHHWTSLGAYTAYLDFCASKGITPISYEEFGFEEVSDSFLGTLHSKNLDISATCDVVSVAKNISECSVWADDKEINIYDYEKLSAKDKYLIFFGNNYGKTIIDTDCKNGKTLLVIKDSFANSFVPLLTRHYERIVMIDQRFYEQKIFSPLISQYQVTDALFMYEITNLSIQTKLTTACKN